MNTNILITFYPSPNINVTKVSIPVLHDEKDDTIIATSGNTYIPNINGFVSACRQAYSNHHNLVIRPDDVWMAIMTQFSMYMEKYGEELRSKFVAHGDQKELKVYGDGNLYTADYNTLSLQLADKISENIKDPSVRDWVMPSFSTTLPADKVVGAIVLMASMKKFFGYKMILCCGLPSVTLLGEVEDWKLVYTKATRLVEFDCEDGLMKKWTEMLLPILNEFVVSAEGNPNLEWWNRVCTLLTRGSGPSEYSGWITVFSVFNDKGMWCGDRKEIKDTWTLEKITSPWPIIENNDFARGSVEVNVTVDDNGTEYKTVLTAGSMGYTISNETTIQPVLAWMLKQKHKHKQEKKSN